MFCSPLIRCIFRPQRVLGAIFLIGFIYSLQSLRRLDQLDLRRRSTDGQNSSSSSTSNNTEKSANNDTNSETPCIHEFLLWYEDYCNAHVRPKYRPLNETNATQLCPCVPSNLVGFVPVNETVPSIDQLKSDGGIEGLEEDGRWRPSWCVARQRVAIIIPYAERERHLRIFLSHMHPLLQRQLIDYSIFIIEQLHPKLFNRAALMNVGFVESRKWTSDDKERPFDCFIFHDVDQLPIEDRNFYVCSECPRHVVGYRKKLNYTLNYPSYFGGGNAFTEENFQLINGFSNTFYGWGGEDDDLYQRTVAMKMSRMRYPMCISRYDEVKHERDKRNPTGVNRPLGSRQRPKAYPHDGLNTLNNAIEATQRTKPFTKISVRLPPPPPPPEKHRSFY